MRSRRSMRASRATTLPPLVALVISLLAVRTIAFAPPQPSSSFSAVGRSAPLFASKKNNHVSDDMSQTAHGRRPFLSQVLTVVCGGLFGSSSANAVADEEDGFAAIAARASKLSGEVGETTRLIDKSDDGRNVFDFSLPVSGGTFPITDIVRQSYDAEGRAKVKAILVVNMKEDDPIARKDIPEFISLAAKYGRDGEFVVILSPSDQGYYEPDTSQLIRLKLASEYGFGINPATIVTDKVNFLGTGAHPFWRWLQRNCRTPAGLGRLEGNYEKFLVDGRTGLPVRRYPRRYRPVDIKNDIEAIIAARPIPPAGANYLEQWRAATVEAERDTYRFQKGLNYFDQEQ